MPVADTHAVSYSSMPFSCPTNEKEKTKKTEIDKIEKKSKIVSLSLRTIDFYVIPSGIHRRIVFVFTSKKYPSINVILDLTNNTKKELLDLLDGLWVVWVADIWSWERFKVDLHGLKFILNKELKREGKLISRVTFSIMCAANKK